MKRKIMTLDQIWIQKVAQCFLIENEYKIQEYKYVTSFIKIEWDLNATMIPY